MRFKDKGDFGTLSTFVKPARKAVLMVAHLDRREGRRERRRDTAQGRQGRDGGARAGLRFTALAKAVGNNTVTVY